MKVRSALTVQLAATLVLVSAVAGELPAQHRAVVSGTVRNSVTRAPVANAAVIVTSGRRSSVTGGDGRYRIVVDSSLVEMRVTALGFAPASRVVPVTATTEILADFLLDPSAVPLKEVITIGARGYDRTATGSAVPVDVISNQMMNNTGLVETWQQLQRLVPSLNVPHIPIGDNGFRPITLRGLAPHHSLVLVNGKRRHPAAALLAGPSAPFTSFTDLNAIPASAIERVEVLRDGAAALYGSDAIAGGVNVILKSGRRRDFQISAGQIHSSEGNRDFHDGRIVDVTGTFGVMSAGGARVALSGEVRKRNGTNRAYPDQRQQYFQSDPRNNEPPRVSSYLGNGALNDVSLFLNADAPVGSRAELYAFAGAISRNDISPDAFFRRPNDPRTVRAIFPNGFLPQVGSRIGDLSMVTGVRGLGAGWNWDLSSGWGGNGVSYHVGNSNNASLGATSPTEFYAGRIAAQQWTSNADVSRAITVGSIPVTLAGGAEFRLDRYQIRAGEPDSWRDGDVRIPDGPLAGQRAAVGAQGIFGFRPIDEVSAHRNNTGAYLEAEGRPFQRLVLQSAVRAERYSDFGSRTDGKLAARMELLDGVAMRASVSTGFRAPALMQQYFSNTRTVFQQVNGVNAVLSVRTFPVNTPEAQLLGARALRPETSVSRSVGLVLDRPRLPQITADVYRITIDDRIGLGAPVTGPSIIRLFDENGLRGTGGGNFATNAIATSTRGVDVVANQAFLLGRDAALRIRGGYSYAKSRVTDVAPPPPQLAASGSVLFNRMSLGIIEHGQPRETFMLGLNYTTGKLGLNVQNQRSGPTAQLDQTRPEADQYVSAKWITDVRAAYQLRARVQMALSAANLFDVYPTEWLDFKDGLKAQGVSMQGIFRYPGALSAFGMNGRSLNIQLRYQ